MNKNSNNKYSTSSFLKFIIPSIIGIFLFMTPIKIDGNFTIPVAFLSNYVVTKLSDPTVSSCYHSFNFCYRWYSN